MPLPTRPDPVLPSLLTAAVVGLATLAVPTWLAYDNPTGIDVVDGVVVHAADAPAARVRGHAYVGDWTAADRVDPGARPAVRELGVGVTHLCLDGADEVELVALRAVPVAGTPRARVRGMVRRLEPNSILPDGTMLASGFQWEQVPRPGETSSDAEILGTWHALAGARVTAPCVDREPDIFVTGGEEVVAAVDVDVRGIDLDRFELDALVEGRHHRIVVDADVTVCGTEVRDPYCDEDDDA